MNHHESLHKTDEITQPDLFIAERLSSLRPQLRRSLPLRWSMAFRCLARELGEGEMGCATGVLRGLPMGFGYWLIYLYLYLFIYLFIELFIYIYIYIYIYIHIYIYMLSCFFHGTFWFKHQPSELWWNSLGRWRVQHDVVSCQFKLHPYRMGPQFVSSSLATLVYNYNITIVYDTYN